MCAHLQIRRFVCLQTTANTKAQREQREKRDAGGEQTHF